MNEQLQLTGPSGLDENPAAPSGAKQVDTLGAMTRHWRLILGIGVAGAIVAFLVCQTLTTLYAATATIMIDPREFKVQATGRDPNSALPPSEETVRKNEIAFIRSRKLAEAVISDMKLDQGPEFNSKLGTTSSAQRALAEVKDFFATLQTLFGLANEPAEEPASSSSEIAMESAVDAFLSRLAVTSADASRVVEIRFLSRSPERAARIANAIADRYLLQKVKENYAVAQSATEALQKEIDALNVKVRDTDRLIETTRSKEGLLPTADLNVIAQQISQLNGQLVVGSEQRVAAEARLADLVKARASGQLDSVASVLGSRLVQNLQEQETQLSAKIADLSTTYGDANPRLVQVRAQLKGYRERIDAEVAKAVFSYRSDVTIAQAKEATLQKMVGDAKATMARANAAEVDVHAIEREAEGNRSLLKDLVDKLNTTRAQINRTPDARIISNATIPYSPSFPPKLAVMAIAFVFCATGCSILSVLIEGRDKSIRSIWQLRRITNLRVLGDVPYVKLRRLHRSSSGRVVAEARSMFAEKLRAVWFHLDHLQGTQAKTLLFTSPVACEGKTSIAVSLARLLALAGRNVVIVDADLRHPSVHRMLGLERSPGLAELVEEECSLDDVLQIDQASGAKVITAGIAVSSPSQILQSHRVRQVLDALSSAYDNVIIDTPPVLAVQDAGIVAKRTDMSVMVVRWGATKATTFTTALRQLHDLDIPVSGVILSMVDPKKYGTYGYPDGDIFCRGMRKYYTS